MAGRRNSGDAALPWAGTAADVVRATDSLQRTAAQYRDAQNAVDGVVLTLAVPAGAVITEEEIAHGLGRTPRVVVASLHSPVPVNGAGVSVSAVSARRIAVRVETNLASAETLAVHVLFLP